MKEILQERAGASMIRFIWLDLGYTLVKTHQEEVYFKTLQVFDVSKTLDEITIAYHLADKLFMREFGAFWVRTVERSCLGTWACSTIIFN